MVSRVKQFYKDVQQRRREKAQEEVQFDTRYKNEWSRDAYNA